MRLVARRRPFQTPKTVIPIQPATLPKNPTLTEEDRAARWEASQQNAVIKRYEERVKNPLTAIRAKCIQCSNGQPKEVLHCTVKVCALYPYRMGNNPNNLRTKAKNAGLTLEEYKAKFGDGAETEEGSEE